VIIPPKAAAKELGFEAAYEEWEVEKAKREEQQIQRQQQFTQEGDDDDIYEVRHKRRARG
jgi:hypothetical protein